MRDEAGAAPRQRGAARIPFRAMGGFIATLCTLIGTLLALGVIQPFGQHKEQAVAAAVDRITDAGSARVVIRSTFRERHQRVSILAEGAFDYRTRRGRLRYDLSQLSEIEEVQTVPVILDDRSYLVKFDSSLTELRKTPWVRLDPAAIEKFDRELGATGAPLEEVGLHIALGDPSQALSNLKRSTEIEERGQEIVLGTKTTRYEGRIDAEKAGLRQGLSRRASTQAWIDDAGILRRLKVTYPGGSEPSATTIDLFDFGSRSA